MPDNDVQKIASETDAIRRFGGVNIAMVLTDPALADNPIVSANDAFVKLTGFDRSSALGRNCRFLQGEGDNTEERRRIRDAIEAREDITLDIQNVRADGTPFANRLMIAPIVHNGECVQFLGLLLPFDHDPAGSILDHQLKELQHRVKNHLSMIIGLIRQQTRKSQSPHEFSALARRIESLQLLYEELTNGRDDDMVPMGSYLSRIASAIGHIDGRAGIRLQVEIEAVSMPLAQATSIGLVLSELLTNAFQHAFTGRDTGLIDVRVIRLSDQALRLTVADDGIGMPDASDWPNGESLGGRLIHAFMSSMDASLDVRRGGTGTIITVDVPANQEG